MNTTPYMIQPSAVNKTLFSNTSSEIDGDSVQGVIDIPLGASLLIINIFIVVLNTFTIAVIVRFRTKNAIDIFVLALATTDLIKGLVPVPMSVYIYLTKWYLIEGTTSCNFFGWVAFATNSGSMLILTLMSIERFLAIVKPFLYKAWVRPKKIVAVIICAELFTAIHSTLPLIGVGRILPYNEGAYSHFDYSKYSYGTIAYSMFIICYGFSMIVVVMVAYSFVFHKIRDLIHRHRRMSTARSDASHRYDKSMRQMNLKTETMFSYLTVALMVLFWFSWLPFLMVVVASQIGLKQIHPKLDLFAIRIAVVNSMLNPIACAALCKPYRRGIVYYFRVLFSYFGFKAPDKNVWDPWRRKTRHHNTRRQKPSVCEYTDRDFTRSDQFASSYDDSGIGTAEYSRTRIPSVLETYDSYRANKYGRQQDKDLERSVRRLPSLKETHNSTSNTNTALNGKYAFNTVEEEENSSLSSTRSSTSSASSVCSKQEEKSKSSRKGSRLLRLTGSKKDSRKESYDDEEIKDFQISGTPTPSSRRKKLFIDKVQKYLNHKKHRKNSLDLLKETSARRTVSAGNLLDQVSSEDQHQNHGKRKIQSFHIKSKKREARNDEFTKDDENNSENDEEFDRLLIHVPRNRAATLATMDEFEISSYSSRNKLDGDGNVDLLEDNTQEEKDIFPDERCRLIRPSLTNSNHSNVTMETTAPLENGDSFLIRTSSTSAGKVTETQKEENRRCISETFSDHIVFPEDNIKINGRLPKTSDHSIKMIDSITKELVRFSKSSLNIKPSPEQTSTYM